MGKSNLYKDDWRPKDWKTRIRVFFKHQIDLLRIYISYYFSFVNIKYCFSYHHGLFDLGYHLLSFLLYLLDCHSILSLWVISSRGNYMHRLSLSEWIVS
jgi:hypothetical protein